MKKAFLIFICLFQLTLQINHCLIPKQICTSCSPSYYLVNGNCVAIDHCKEMKSDGTCEEWINGYRYDSSSRTCVEIGDDNCLKYTSNGCIECRPWI